MSRDDTSSATLLDQEPLALYDEDDCEGQGSCDSESDDSATGGSQAPLRAEDDSAAQSS